MLIGIWCWWCCCWWRFCCCCCCCWASCVFNDWIDGDFEREECILFEEEITALLWLIEFEVLPDEEAVEDDEDVEDDDDEFDADVSIPIARVSVFWAEFCVEVNSVLSEESNSFFTGFTASLCATFEDVLLHITGAVDKKRSCLLVELLAEAFALRFVVLKDFVLGVESAIIYFKKNLLKNHS